MSNCYLQFNFGFVVPESQVSWVRNVIELIDNATPGEELEKDDPLLAIFPQWDEWGEVGFDVSFSPSENYCGISADEYGNTEHVDHFLRAYLARCYEADKEFREIGYTYSVSGDGEYGGGAVRLFLDGSKVEMEYMTTDGWLSEAFAGKGN